MDSSFERSFNRPTKLWPSLDRHIVFAHNPPTAVTSNRGDHSSSDAPVSDRLDTWKEVASHLRRSVRTVQRWEREEGLPVRRHRHDKQGSIYAFKHELDEWWAARGPLLEPTESSGEIESSDADAPPEIAAPTLPLSGATRRPRRLVVGLVAVTVLSTAVTVILIQRAREPAAETSHGEPHRILIADFQNHTDDPQLGLRLRDLVRDQFSVNRVAKVVPVDQVAYFLRLMRKPADSHIDASLAREITLRDGAIDAYVVGVVDRLDTAYVANISIMSPGEATVAFRFSTNAASPAQLIAGVRRTLDARSTEVDSSFPHGGTRSALPRVTTASFRALELYSEAVALMDEVPMKTGPAFELLTEAVRLDPDFASAHILAAWALRNEGQPDAKMLPHAERAFRLADTTTDAEHYFILGSYYQLTLSIEKAIASYEALLRLEPDNYWAMGNLGRLYRAVGRYDAVADLGLRRVALRPQQFWGNYRLAEALFLQGDFSGAEKAARLAAALVSEKDPIDLQSRRSWMAILPACTAWLRDDVQRASVMVSDLESQLSVRQGADRVAMTTSVGYMYLALGHRDGAERTFRRLPQRADRLYHSAISRSHFGSSHGVRDYFASLPEPPGAGASFHGFPTLGQRWAGETSVLLDRWKEQMSAADLALLRGQLALMQGRPADAIRLLKESIGSREDRHGAPALSASLGIARAFQRSGDVEQAVHVLEEASQNRYTGCLWPAANAYLWVQLRYDLAELYRRVGRDTDADAIGSQLRTVLALADEDHLVKARVGRDAVRTDDMKPMFE